MSAERSRITDSTPIPPTESSPKFWSGKDVRAGQNTIIHSGAISTIPVCIGVDALPSLDVSRFTADQFADQVRKLSVASRSFLAQLGVETMYSASQMVAHFWERRSIAAGLNSDFSAEVQVVNHGGRPITIRKGMGIFGFYQPGERIIGEELLEMMGSEITIDGKEGKIWTPVYKDRYTKNPKDITGIAVRIEEGHRYYIPQDPEPIDAQAVRNAEDYRAALRAFYRPLSSDVTPDIWFGRLPEIGLSAGVAIELDEEVASSLRTTNDVDQLGRSKQFPHGRHIGARLLRPDKQWPIMVEIKVPSNLKQQPSYVVIRPMKANGLA